MRRIAYEDPKLDGVKVLVDMPEEMFQSLKKDFGKKNLRLYIGTLAQQCIQRANHALMFGEDK